jgi:hypothetical protein
MFGLYALSKSDIVRYHTQKARGGRGLSVYGGDGVI